MKFILAFFFTLCFAAAFSQNDYDRKVTVRSNDGNKESVMIRFRCIPTNLNLQQPLIFVDDEPKEFLALREVNVKEIDRIEVMQGEEAIRKYGDKAKGGVVLIYIKVSAVKRAYI